VTGAVGARAIGVPGALPTACAGVLLLALPTACAGVLLLALPTACARSSEPPSAAAAPIEIRQDQLDEDERIPVAVATTVARVLRANREFLGADPIDFCGRMVPAQRTACLAEATRIPTAEIDGPALLEENAELREGGREWPGATAAVSAFRRLRLAVPLRKGSRTTTHEATLVVFDSRSGATTERCVFPLEHWSWSELHRPERFAHAPVGVCNDRALTVTEYLLERAPDAAPTALRFLSETEARAWRSDDPEQIKWESPYTAGHPYAKYFLLDSERWWRGGTRAARRDRYAWAVRIRRLPLRRLRELEQRGALFLDIFEDAAQIELTSVTEEGLRALLDEEPEILVDVSGAGATAPRFEPFHGAGGS